MLSYKYIYKVTGYDLFVIVYKDLFKKELSQTEKVIQKAYFYMKNEFSYTNLMKEYLNSTILKEYLLGKKDMKYVNFPSLDLSCLSRVEELFEILYSKDDFCSMSNDDLENVIDNDFSIERNKKKIDYLVNI